MRTVICSFRRSVPLLALAMTTIKHPKPVLSLFQLSVSSFTGEKPLAVFECRDRRWRDWPHTLVTYEKAFPPGALHNEEVHLQDAA